MLRRLINLVVAGAVVLAAASLALFGPRPFEAWLPQGLYAFTERLVGPEGLLQLGAVRPGDVPADFLADGPDGLVATGPVAASAGNEPVFISSILAGHVTRLDQAVPAEITTIRPILGCRLTPPLPGTVVGHAYAGESGMALPILSYGDKQLALAIADFVARYRKADTATATEIPGIAYQAYDVAVTDTSAPVYLVLVAGEGNWIWNIHLAEGVRIERVVLLGGSQAGVANLDPVIPVEVLRNDGLAECGIAPAYPLNPGHLDNHATASDSEARARRDRQAELANAFDIWFRDSFGVTASESRVGYDRGLMSLIGPVPATADRMARYRLVAGGQISMTEDTYLEIRGQVAEAESFVGRVTALTTRFAFGDLGTLRQGVDF